MWKIEYTALLANILVGSTFIFSGLAKLNDLRSFAHKIEEYLRVLASQLTGWARLFLPYTVCLALAIATAEVTFGTAVVIYWHRYWTLLSLLLLTLFFTALTFYTAISKRIVSCGCFGGALELAPWQSFGKSIVLLSLIGVLCWQESSQPVVAMMSGGGWIVAGALLTALSLGSYTLRYLPVIDWSPYKVGSDLHQHLPPSPNATLEDPSSSTEQFGHAGDSELRIWQGAKDRIRDVLTGNKVLLIVQAPEILTTKVLQELQAFVNNPPSDTQIILLSKAGNGEILAPLLQLTLYTAQPLLLQRMLQTSTGALHLRDGVVVGKWHYRDLKHMA
ncbi:MAG: MauE/DoxX family redox-associated membrane protein [Bacteroidota bacterium]